jgi:hypothetical protein
MSKTLLSPEIVSLVHHVELNQSGWWRKAVSQVVKGILWKAQGTMTQMELGAALKRELGIQLAEEALAKQLDLLASQGAVARLPGPNFKLTEKTNKELTESHDDAIKEQEECRATFLGACAQHCPTLDGAKVWGEFSKALNHAITVTGANLFHLLADGELERDVDWFAEFLSKFEHVERSGLAQVLSVFFSPESRACRNQVLRLLTAHFFAEASQLRPETLALIEGEKKTRSIKIVLDTNFIFSVLGLHDNPGDDAALSLLDVAQKSGANLEVRFYVLPSTLDEARRVLLNQMHSVERIRTTRAMARAALTQTLPSVAKKFFDAASRSPGLTATTFFQPYIDDLRSILRDKGISVLEAHQTVYHQRQDVVDDVLDEQRREEAEVPEQKRKSYETLLHDAVLWHAVMDRRSADADSPFDVEYWAVSIDWRLIAFDRKKRSTNASRMPVVLHPSNLVQLVQFWVPRSTELDQSLVDSLRLPMFFQSFDPDDERATVKVLEALSRYENVGDLPEQTLKKVLANQALRGRLRDADASNDEAIALIREELLTEHRDALAQLESARRALYGAQETLSAERRTRMASQAELDAKVKAVQDAEAKVAAAEQLAAEEAASRESLEEQLRLAKEATERELKAQKDASEATERRLVRQRYALAFVILPMLLGVALVFVCYGPAVAALPELAQGWKRWAFVAGLGLLPLAIACLLSPLHADSSKHLSDWWVCKWAKHLGRKGIAAPVTAALTAVYQGGAWDWVKAVSGFNP